MLNMPAQTLPSGLGWLRLGAGPVVLLVALAGCGGGGSSSPAKPAISTFTATQASIVVGDTASLTACFTNGTGSVDQGVGAVVSGTPVTIHPLVDTTYTLTVTGAGTSLTQTVQVQVVPDARITAPTYVSAGDTGLRATVATLSGATYQWAIEGGAITSGGDTAEVTYTASAAGSLKLACKVTNQALHSTDGAATVTVVALPAITAFTAAPAAIGIGGGAMLSPIFAGGVGVVTPGPLPVTSGGSLNVTPGISTDYTLTVTSLAGRTTAITTGLLVDPTPFAILSFTSSQAQVEFGGAGLLNWQVTGLPVQLSVDGASVLGTTSLPIRPVRRQDYRLAGSNGNGSDARTVSVAARGLDLLAGNLNGSGYLDGHGSAARFRYAMGLVGDGGSGLFVVDTGTIRRVSATGEVTTYAGEPKGGSVVNGPLASARFPAPAFIARAADGTLFVTDAYCVRKISVDGVVSTYAGGENEEGTVDGPRLDARFGQPMGIVVDASQNVYLADKGQHTIRKISAEGVVTTLAGASNVPGTADGPGAQARFNGPIGLALDALGNLWVSDTDSYTLRKITPAGVVSTEAGQPGVWGSQDGPAATATFAGLRGLAVDASGGVVICCTGGGTPSIRRLSPQGIVTTMAGGTWGSEQLDGPVASAQFPSTYGIMASPSGILYVSETNRVRRVDPLGAVTTIAGAAGLYGMRNGTGAEARFSFPQAITMGPAGVAYVSDMNNQQIRAVTPAGVVSTFSDYSANLEHPAALVCDPAGNVYAADWIHHVIWKHAASGGTTVFAGILDQSGAANGPRGTAQFNSPSGLGLDGLGNFYVADTGNHTVRRITPDGTVSTHAGQAGAKGFTDGAAGSARFFGPWNLVADPAGTVYVSDGLSIRKVALDGSVSTFAGSIASQGYVDGPGGSARFREVAALALDGQGNLLVADAMSNLVRKVSPAGMVSTMAGNDVNSGTIPGPLPATLFRPVGLAVTPAGDVLVVTANGIAQITAP